MSTSCTLLLTQGTYVLDEASASVVELALESGARSVDIAIDLTGSGNVLSRARISMRHVIGVFRTAARVLSDELPDDSNIYALRR